MTSDKKARANRANGKLSRGPRTANGKRRSSRNAQRHGLGASVWADPALVTQLKKHGLHIAGEDASLILQELACEIAAAQLERRRVREARRSIFVEVEGEAGESNIAEIDYLSRKFPAIADRLHALDRYERRAMSRRKSAIRVFDSQC